MAKHKDKTPEINEIDLEEIANQIKDGVTSGRADNGEGKHISWKIEMNVWQD